MDNKDHYFRAIAENGSITKAAQQLYVSQPYLSKYLQQLESSLDVTLFERKGNSIKLTYAGEIYLNYVISGEQLKRKLRCELDEVNSGLRGKLSIGIHLWRSSKMLPTILPDFIKHYPNADVKLFEGSSPYLQELLQKDVLDFCIMHLPIDFENFSYEIIMREKILLVGRKDNPIVIDMLNSNIPHNGFPHFDITALNGQILYLMKAGEQISNKTNGVLNRFNVTPSRIIETANQNTAINLAAASDGFTFVPQAGMRYSQISDDLVYFTVGEPVLEQTLILVYHKNTYRTALARAMIEMIKSRYADAFEECIE